MDPLPLTQIRPILELLLPALLNKPGLMASLPALAERSSGATSSVLRSLYENLSRDQSLARAIENIIPPLPRVVCDLLILGGQTGSMDYVIQDMLKAWETIYTEVGLAAQFTVILDQRRLQPRGKLVCVACFERDFDKVLRRARLEEAREVIFEQEGEEFLHQWYIAAKPLHLIEPSHSMFYNTVLKALTEAAQTCQSLQPWQIKVKSIAERQFQLSGENLRLTVEFR